MSDTPQTPEEEDDVPLLPPTPQTHSTRITPVQIQSLSPTTSSAATPLPISAPVAPYVVPTEHPEELPPEVEVESDPFSAVGSVHHEPVPRQNAFVEYWKKAGGGSFMISLAIHAGLLVAAFFVVDTIVHEKKVDFLPGGGSKESSAAGQQLTQQVQTKRRSSMTKSAQIRKIAVSGASATISLPDSTSDTIDMPDLSSSLLGGGAMGSGGFSSSSLGAGGGFGKGQGIGGQAGFISLPPTMKSRCSSAERLQKLKDSGGTPECEKAVSQALEWLKSKQNKDDGSWGTNFKASMTGLVLLCYLGRCETPDSPFYGDNVMNGILYLIELSKKNEHGFFTTKPESNSGAYEHGIATYALGEMYTLARMGSKTLPGMREAFERGVELIIETQHEDGSWDYYTKEVLEKTRTKRSDLSVTGWQYQALKAAKHTNLNIKGLNSAINKAVKYLESTQTKDGGFGNPNREAHYNQYSLTGTAVLGIQTLGRANSSSVKKGLEFSHTLFTKEPPDWSKNANLYCWYYYAQSFFQNGGEEWAHWNATALPQILNNQTNQGNWNQETPDWSIGGTGPAGPDREIYRTALCTLMLEVYYRYLKVGDREANSILAR